LSWPGQYAGLGTQVPKPQTYHFSALAAEPTFRAADATRVDMIVRIATDLLGFRLRGAIPSSLRLLLAIVRQPKRERKRLRLYKQAFKAS